LPLSPEDSDDDDDEEEGEEAVLVVVLVDETLFVRLPLVRWYTPRQFESRHPFDHSVANDTLRQNFANFVDGSNLSKGQCETEVEYEAQEDE
jgi:hypothetical protein